MMELQVGRRANMEILPNDAHRKDQASAVASAVLSAVASLTILIGGWLYPAYLLKFDPDIQSGPDFRAGIMLPISMVLGLIYAVRAGMYSYRIYHNSPRAVAAEPR